MSNWVELSTQWSTLRFYSWSTAQLRADPPPPLADSLLETKPTSTRRRAKHFIALPVSVVRPTALMTLQVASCLRATSWLKLTSAFEHPKVQS
jgi:hypothetical protein